MSRPKILVTNDDGYESEGIIAVGEALRELGDVTVVAPEHDNSGIGHQISIKAPVRAAPVAGRNVRTYRVAGTPADCVVIGALDLCGGIPDLLVSGINRGANVGDDVNYSGTVAAAVEGTIVGVPSLAISLSATWPEDGIEHYWETATATAVQMGRQIISEGLPRLTLLNVNVPNVPLNALRGTRWVRQGRKGYHDRLDRRTDPRGGTYYWLWGTFDASDIVEGTDLAAIRDGYVSVTPLCIDRTNHDELGRRLRRREAKAG